MGDTTKQIEDLFMTNPLRPILLLAVLGLLASSVWCAAPPQAPGGKGVLQPLPIATACFKPGSGTVQEVCAQYKINWKLWTLMGEPMGDYNVAWTLSSITLADPQRKHRNEFTAQYIPSELKVALGRIELYIDGVAAVHAGGSHGDDGFHRFNTGTAVRAGAGSSFNTPGSSNWDKVFLVGRFFACDDKRATYIDAKLAKEKFISGIGLSDLSLCPSSGVSELSALEAAIAKLCGAPGASKQYLFCPIQKPEEKKAAESNPVDDAFSKMEAQTGKTPQTRIGSIDDEFGKMEAFRVEQERLRIAALKAKQEREAREREQQALHDEASQFCTAAMKSEKSCLEDACKQKPRETICLDSREDPIPECVPEYAGDWRCEGSHIVFPTYTCYATGPNPAYSEWELCTRTMASKCVRNGSQPTGLEACISQRVRSGGVK